MRPLRERTTPTSPMEAYAVEVLRASEPYQSGPGTKSRVRAKLLRRPVTPRVRVLGPAPVFAALLLAAGASAAVGRGWVTRVYRGWAEPSAPAAEKSPLAAAARAMKAPSHQRVASSMEGALPIASEQPLAASPGASLGRADGLRPSGQSPERDKLVFDAMRALRREGKPERASALLDEYLRRHPGGSLAEEALALSIEAATMRGDARARELAARYLARYPAGRFRPAAERALARSGP